MATLEKQTAAEPHAPGFKDDAAKPRIGFLLRSFPRALKAIALVNDDGARRYSDLGWLQVEDNVNRYEDAKDRHLLDRLIGEDTPLDSPHLHLAHEAWNALALLELTLRNKGKKDG